MRCPGCDTPLWKVRARRCPACDRPFKPSDFRFRPQTVRFCCPHCEQGYLGAGDDGLPSPRRFECVFCGRVIDADQMVLEIAEGVEEHQTRPDTLPWVETHRPWPARWALTAWLALRDPARLMRLTPASLGPRPALTYCLVTLGGGAIAVNALAWLAGKGLSLPALSQAVASVRGVATVLALLGVTALFLGTWVLLLGAMAGGRSRARIAQAVCLTGLPHALWFLPGVGPLVGWLGTLAWGRAAGRALRETLGPRRARLAMAWPGACAALWVLLAGAWALGLVPGLDGARASWTADADAAVARFDAPIRAAAERGQTLTHPAELMADGALRPEAFCAPGSRTTTADIDLLGTSLESFEGLAPARQLAVIQQAAAQAAGGPGAPPAQRLGDFVFILDSQGLADPGLWVVVQAPDPTHNPAGGPIHILHRDGSTRTVADDEVLRALRDQNRLRIAHQLPTLTDPRTIRPAEEGG